jgi:hypothetical protein
VSGAGTNTTNVSYPGGEATTEVGGGRKLHQAAVVSLPSGGVVVSTNETTLVSMPRVNVTVNNSGTQVTVGGGGGGTTGA